MKFIYKEETEMFRMKKAKRDFDDLVWFDTTIKFIKNNDWKWYNSLTGL